MPPMYHSTDTGCVRRSGSRSTTSAAVFSPVSSPPNSNRRPCTYTRSDVLVRCLPRPALSAGARAQTAPPSQRLYLDAGVDVDEYARRWQGEDRHWIGQYDAAEVRRTLWPWLMQRGYASALDEDELERFLALPGRRPVHLRPGLRLVRTWDPDARRAFGGSSELAAAVRDAVNGVLTAAGEPELPASSAP